MAYSAELKHLEKRRHELIAQSDHLREKLGDQAAKVSAASFWMQQGLQLAQRMLTNQAMISTVLGWFRKSRR